MTLHHVVGCLRPVPPFDFGQTLAFLGMFTPMQAEQVIRGEALTKAIMVGGRPVVFRVRSTGSVEAPELEYTLFAEEPLDAAARRAAADRLGFWLSLDDDLRPFYTIAREEDPRFWPVIERLYGLHQVKFPTPFENACWAVLTQRSPVPVARKAKRALVERYGASLDVEGERYWAFPEAAQLGAAGPDDLFALVRNAKRAEYLAAVIAAFQRVDEGWLRTAPLAEVERWLRAIRGIGDWSAFFILFRGLGRSARLPYTMPQFLDGFARAYDDGPMTPERLAALAARYGPCIGYWSLYARTGH
jgi:DNA-3-methyladenine glycosylase II